MRKQAKIRDEVQFIEAGSPEGTESLDSFPPIPPPPTRQESESTATIQTRMIAARALGLSARGFCSTPASRQLKSITKGVSFDTSEYTPIAIFAALWPQQVLRAMQLRVNGALSGAPKTKKPH